MPERWASAGGSFQEIMERRRQQASLTDLVFESEVSKSRADAHWASAKTPTAQLDVFESDPSAGSADASHAVPLTEAACLQTQEALRVFAQKERRCSADGSPAPSSHTLPPPTAAARSRTLRDPDVSPLTEVAEHGTLQQQHVHNQPMATAEASSVMQDGDADDQQEFQESAADADDDVAVPAVSGLELDLCEDREARQQADVSTKRSLLKRTLSPRTAILGDDREQKRRRLSEGAAALLEAAAMLRSFVRRTTSLVRTGCKRRNTRQALVDEPIQTPVAEPAPK